MSSVYRSVAAWRHTVESVLTLGDTLTDPQWAAPTECPKWTVKDVYAHLIGGEQWMASGHPRPEHDCDTWAAGPVLARRETPPATLLAELRQVYEQRRIQLEEDTIDPEQPAHLPTGDPVPLWGLLRSRVFDVWVHEQDIRRAVGQPDNLAGPGAAVAGEVIVGRLPRVVAKTAKAPAGSTVRLTTTGEVPIDVAVVVNGDGQGAMVAPGGPARVHLTLSWEAYARLACGRGSRNDHDVRITGDRALGDRLLASLNIAP